MAAALGLPDESSAEADKFIVQMQDHETWVPSLWWHEIGNVLVSARRRRRISDSESSALLQLYGDLPIRTDYASGAGVLERIHRLSMSYQLSAYDAAYLELAERKQSGLATLDQKLLLSARDCGIETFHA